MRLYKIDKAKEIFENKEIADVISLAIINPGMGKLQNIAQSIYSKQQGIFFTAVKEDIVIGIIGLKRLNKDQVEIMHLASNLEIEEEKKELYKDMIYEAKKLIDVKEIVIEITHTDLKLYKSIGFKCKKMPEQGLDYDRFFCRLF
ncbi:hypothetical protein [Helicovermis profundi]|uniref:N-acetyltransferase domain-containing protein n=1 Tax=Helicovermis profundi TaxID=3065157 RepID=A0AAU9ED08_9FIRM|nr:hypothetical protein HLPR_22080 [Clostridia bacterium S502]